MTATAFLDLKQRVSKLPSWLIFDVRQKMQDEAHKILRRPPRYVRLLFAVAIINFGTFFVIAAASGGDAINGKTEGGRHFIMARGQFTEVSASFYTYSAVHAVSVWMTHLLAAGSVIYWLCLHHKSHPKRSTH